MTTPLPNFDRVAHLYRWAEWISLGPLLERTREHFLPQLSSCRCALVLGDGDGRFLARLLQQAPHLEALAVDTSAAMLRLLGLRCGHHRIRARLTTVQSDAMQVHAPAGVDLIVTHFFLDCLQQPQVDELTARLADEVQPGTLWLLSDFAVPRHGLLRPLGALYIRALYLTFRILTGLRVTRLPNPQRSLEAAGFERIAHHERLHGLLYTELWARRYTRSQETRLAAHDMEPIDDPIPETEPAVPSLPGPDLGVFGHEPAPLPPTPAEEPR